MDKIDNINVDRILWGCANQRITTDDLARQVGISKTTMDKLIENQDSITFNQLKKIADYFGRGVLFFLEDSPVDEDRLFSPAFRTIANQKIDLDPGIKAIIERAEKQRDVYVSLIGDEQDDIPRFSPIEMPDAPEEAAIRARQWLGIRENNDFASFREAIESKGILVFLTNGYRGKWQIPKSNPILGFSLYDESLPLIVVKKARRESRQNFTLMHELAHILIHRQSVIDDEKDFTTYTGKERAANRFAAHLLAPQEFLSQVALSDKPHQVDQFDQWLRPYRERWGVSTEMMLLRLMDIDAVQKEEYQAYKAWFTESEDEEQSRGTRIYRHREPRNIFGDRYVRSVLNALDRDKITLNKASKFLDGIKVSDIRKLEAYCASL